MIDKKEFNKNIISNPDIGPRQTTLHGTNVNAYYKKVDNVDIAAFVYKEGSHKGGIATTFKLESSDFTKFNLK